MNLIEIIALLAVVAAGYLYWSERGKRKNLARDSAEKITRLEGVIAGGKAENLRISGMISELRQTIKEREDSIASGNLAFDKLYKESQEYKEGSQRLLVRTSKAELELEEVNKELANLREVNSQNTLPPLQESFNKHFQPVLNSDFPFQFRTLIDWADIEISLSDLIDDGKLFDVFTSLLNAGLFPESITNTIDYNEGDGQVIIYTQEFNPSGEVTRCLTWHEIITQILFKKKAVVNYLKEVIQDSDRAMVVHAVLANKPKKEVASV